MSSTVVTTTFWCQVAPLHTHCEIFHTDFLTVTTSDYTGNSRCSVIAHLCHKWTYNSFQFLPISRSYSLRTRTHNRQLPVTRMLFYQSYWHSSAFIISFTVNGVNNCFFVCSNAVYILHRCCNCGLPVINQRICYVMLCYITHDLFSFVILFTGTVQCWFLSVHLSPDTLVCLCWHEAMYAWWLYVMA